MVEKDRSVLNVIADIVYSKSWNNAKRNKTNLKKIIMQINCMKNYRKSSLIYQLHVKEIKCILFNLFSTK